MQEMSSQRYPNKLKALAIREGYRLNELAQEINVPNSAIYYYSRGQSIIPRKIRLALAPLLSCEPQDLAPLNCVV